MVVDCFPFGGESDLLELRLDLLWDSVDLFVVTEVGESHSGLIKPIYLESLGPRLQKYQSKLKVISAPRFPSHLFTGFEKDWWQRELARDFLSKTLAPDSLLLYGDVDEIPEVSALKKAIDLLKLTDMDLALFAQDLLYIWVNYREKTGRLLSSLGEFEDIPRPQRKWLGSGLWRWRAISSSSLTSLRSKDTVARVEAVRIPNGGWHFSYVSGPAGSSGFERFEEKLTQTAHQEFNRSDIRQKFESRIRRGRDPLGRRFVRFEKVEDLGFLPEQLTQNPRFDHLFLK